MVAAEFFEVELPRGVNVSLAMALRLAAIILLGPAFAILLTVAAFGLSDGLLKRFRKPWFKVAFNTSMHAIASGIAGFSYLAMFDGDAAVANSVQDVAAVATAGFLYVAANSMMISVVVALTESLPIGYVWAKNERAVLPQYLAMLPIGIVFALLWQSYPWATPLFLLPLGVVHYSFKARVELEQQTEQALVAMADILDKRDPSTARHSERVAMYAGKIGFALGLPQEEVETIVASARLHDLGKIGISDSILKKPGNLSPTEREDIERHTEIGAHILGYFRLFGRGVSLLRHHHERYDGQGYPSGLRGEDIPLGARIIQVADTYEAMTAPRYYREPIPEEEVRAYLRAGAGTQFDPMVVGAFLKVLAEEEYEKAEVDKIRRIHRAS
jgi:hypothetical protein